MAIRTVRCNLGCTCAGSPKIGFRRTEAPEEADQGLAPLARTQKAIADQVGGFMDRFAEARTAEADAMQKVVMDQAYAILKEGEVEETLRAYIEAAGLDLQDKRAPLFRSAERRTGCLTPRPMTGKDVLRMVKRRLKDAGLPANFS